MFDGESKATIIFHDNQGNVELLVYVYYDRSIPLHIVIRRLMPVSCEMALTIESATDSGLYPHFSYKLMAALLFVYTVKEAL